MKKTLHKTIFFTVIILLLFSCSNKNKRETNIEQYISEEIDKLEKENFNQIILNQKIFLGNDSVKQFTLKDFISEERIFFWFSQNTCSPCIDRCVDIIKKVFPDYVNNESIIFVSPDYPIRFRQNCYKKKLLTLQNKYFGLELEKKDVPFFFMLNSNSQIEVIHIVNKNDFKRTEKYLYEMKNLIDIPHN